MNRGVAASVITVTNKGISLATARIHVVSGSSSRNNRANSLAGSRLRGARHALRVPSPRPPTHASRKSSLIIRKSKEKE